MSGLGLDPTYLDGYGRGYLDGIERGRQQLSEEIAETQRRAMNHALLALDCKRAGVVIPGVAA